jgi:hypothetical protein
MKYIYGAICGAELDVESFDLGEDVHLSRTSANFASLWHLSFDPAGPFRATSKASKSYGITIELRIPEKTSLGDKFPPEETLWLIVALMRLGGPPTAFLPFYSDLSLSEMSKRHHEPKEPPLQPLELEPRSLNAGNSTVLATSEVLEWLKECWLSVGKLIDSQPTFYSAFKAFDVATVRGRISPSLLALWGGLEQIFAPSAGELRFRVSALLASYLYPPGEERYRIRKSSNSTMRDPRRHTRQPIVKFKMFWQLTCS